MNDKVLIELTVSGCNKCPFLNCSDTGEDCSILRQGIQEGEWSNINFQYGDCWRYKNCPLIHPEGYLMRGIGLKVIK